MTRLVRPIAVAALAAVLAACTSSDEAKHRYLESGKQLAAGKNYGAAIVAFRNALQIDDKFGEARVQLAETLAANGNPEGAYREYQRAADLLPNDAAVQKRAATLLFMAGQFEDVRARALELLKTQPNDVEAQLLYANALVGLNDPDAALEQIEQAIALDPSHGPSYTNLALLQLARGHREDAKAAFEKAVSLDPASLKARLALSYFHLATGDGPSAEQALNAALQLDPRDPLANRTLALLYLGTGRAALAEKPLRLVVEVTKSARAKFALADYYIRAKRPADATSVLAPMLKDSQTFADAQMRLAHLTYQSGDHAGAKKMLATVLSQNPGHSPGLQLRARWLLVDGYPQQALERVTQAVSAAPRDVAAIYLRGTLQALAGQRAAAVKSFWDVLRLNPRAAAAQVQLAQLSLSEGEADAAVGLGRDAVTNDPRSPEARIVLARAFVAQRDFTSADAEIGRVLARHPKAPSAHAIKGTLELLRGNRAAARTAFQTAFDLDPRSIAALSGLTMLDVQQGRTKDARARVERRLPAEPGRVQLLLLAGRVFAADGDLVKAEIVLREALELAPAVPEPYMLLADIYRSQHRLDSARADLDAQVQRDAANIGARSLAAVLVHADGKLAEAKRRYTEVLGYDPRIAVAANNLAWMYADEKQNLDEALDLAQRATEQIPEYAEAWDTLGWVFVRKQLPLLAILPFEKAVEKEPSNATFHYHLGMALAGAGDEDKSREALQTALTLQPNFPDAQRGLKALDQ